MVTQQGGDEAAVQQVMTVLQDPDMEQDALAFMAQVFVGVKEKVLKKVLKSFVKLERQSCQLLPSMRTVRGLWPTVFMKMFLLTQTAPS